MTSRQSDYFPLVVGAPRTGFTLLITIARNLYAFAGEETSNRLRIMRYFADRLGSYVADEIISTFAKNGIDRDLVFSPMFHPLIGGPKWILEDDPRYACIRKYIGVRGMGDFTLIVRLPRKFMELDTVVHSHPHPSMWLEFPEFQQHTRFASVRNPCGALNSAVFSINAITSEYIQRFLPPEKDNDLLRQHVAKFKLTNLEFFQGLANYYVAYMQNFNQCRQHFIVMRWEDLIRNPVDTILNLGRSAGIPIAKAQAEAMWRDMRYRNLTGPHRHNYRQGKGIVGDWKNSLVNAHIDIIKNSGLDALMRPYGYPPIEYLDEDTCTPYQQEMDTYIREGKVFDDYPDRDLFIFDFQKSNIQWDGLLDFRAYPWNRWTRIERSCMTDDDVPLRVCEAADKAVQRIVGLLSDIADEDWTNPGKIPHRLALMELRHENVVRSMGNVKLRTVFADARQLEVRSEPAGGSAPSSAWARPFEDMSLFLDFVAGTTESTKEALLGYIKRGAKKILLRPFNDKSVNLIEALKRSNTPDDVTFFALGDECRVPLHSDVRQIPSRGEMDLTVICSDGAGNVSELLHDCIDLHTGVVVAPVTGRFWKKNVLFLISPQKSGTHLLFELARALGYIDGLVLSDPPQNGHWYFLEFSNAHTPARDFFIDSVRRATFGNRRHPFRTSPALFNYRHPLDMLVSEAFYYSQDGKTSFGGYLNDLDFASRLLRLIDDPWLLGTIRDRIGQFIAWLDFPNVIPVSFEEMVGSKGGGEDVLLERLVWSLQLKLHVPGAPGDIAERIYNESSPTFRKGQIGAYRQQFTPEAMSKFRKLPQDFMDILGYTIDVDGKDGVFSNRIEEFRNRKVKLGKEHYGSLPIVVEYDYLGHDIVVYHRRYYGRPIPTTVDFERDSLAGLPQAESLTELKRIITRQTAREGTIGAFLHDINLPEKLRHPKRTTRRFVQHLRGRLDRSRGNKG